MSLPTEPIGSVPRPQALIDGMQAFQAGFMSKPELDALRDAAVRDTIENLEGTGSPVISDGEQGKPSFATYPIQGLEHLAPEGVAIRFADGHVRQLPRLTAGPFRYKVYAVEYLTQAQRYAHVPVKQAVISASALSLLYPSDGLPGYPREAFLEDLLREHEADIRRCLAGRAHVVQVDFTEGRLAIKLDPSRISQKDLHAAGRTTDSKIIVPAPPPSGSGANRAVSSPALGDPDSLAPPPAPEYRGFLSFSLAGIPVGAWIESAAVTVTADVPEALPLVNADAEQVKRALINLVDNAIEAMADTPGTITVRFGALSVPAFTSSLKRLSTSNSSRLPRWTIVAMETGIPTSLVTRIPSMTLSNEPGPRSISCPRFQPSKLNWISSTQSHGALLWVMRVPFVSSTRRIFSFPVSSINSLK